MTPKRSKKAPPGSVQRGTAWLIAKASRNKAFRAELLQNPKAVAERVLGIKLGPKTIVRVVENTAKTEYIVLPRKPRLPKATVIGGKLTDGELLGLLESDGGPIGLSFCPNENDNI